MSYSGVPKELTSKMDKCVTKVMKDGKDKTSATAICKTSIMSQKKKKEEKPYEIVADKSSETRCIYFSSSPIEKKLNASKDGKLLKNIEIFKSGTYRGIQFKNSGLDKMVANFYFLKSHNILPNVPVRADHPSFMGVGGVIDKVGGYVSELKRVGNKLVADIRVTSDNMWDKIEEGSYINRSAEIGTYDDNDGTIYSPILYGFAWVDIPQVEGLSPKFSYSKDNKNFDLINLNAIQNMSEEIKETFPPEEIQAEEVKEEKIEKVEEVPAEKAEEAPAEEAKEEVPAEKVEEVPAEKAEGEFKKLFAAEYTELTKLRAEKVAFLLEKRESFIDGLLKEGKVTPAQLEAETAFAKDLTEEQFDKYKVAKENSPKIVKFEEEEVEVKEGEKLEGEDVEKTADEKADDFIKETNK